LAYITLFTELLPLIFCILFYKKLNTKALKVFFIYCILLSVFVLISFLAITNHFTSLYLLNIRIYVVVEYTIFSIFFFYILKKSIPKRIIIFSILPFIIFSFYDLFNTGKANFSYYPLIIEFLVFIVVLIYFFYEKMQTVVLYPLYQSITFWICVGLFIYFTGNFFYLLFSKSSTDPKFQLQMKIIYSFVTISKNVLLSLALFANEPNEENNNELQIPTDLNLDEFSLTNLKKS